MTTNEAGLPAEKGPDDLTSIREDEPAEVTVGAATFELEVAAHRLEALQENLQGLRQDRGERKKYANRIFCLVVGWLAAIVILLVLQGFLGPLGWFALSNSILITAVGSTTASVVALFVLVTKYLFPRR